MNFFKKLQNSIYSPEFYATVPKNSFGSAFGYFMLLILFVSLIQSVIPIYTFATVGQKKVDQFINKAENAYPVGLEVKIHNGQVATNLPEPFMVPITDDKNQPDIENLVVIDTKTPFSTTQFKQYKTVAWVTKDSIFVKGSDRGQLKTIDLSTVKDFTMNKSTVDSFIQKVSPWLKIITPVVIAGILIGLFFVNFFRLIYLFILTLVIYALLRLFKKPLGYGETYKVVMHGVTLGLLIEAVGLLVSLPGFPFMLTLITIVVVLFNYLSAPQKTTAKMKK